mgnify:CR=1 FL=1
MNYSIIIPVHNEQDTLPRLLKELKQYSHINEILFIDDGSDDLSNRILSACPFINLITLDKNYGKGLAIRKGLLNSKYKSIIITDSDLELKTQELTKLMILNKNQNIHFVLGSRFEINRPLDSIWDIGNFLLTKIFNLKNFTNLKDALSCSKSFYKNDINISNLKSNNFDIDVEISSLLIKTNKKPIIIPLSYNRRSIYDGKKLKISDGFKIFLRILHS